MSDAARVNTFN